MSETLTQERLEELADPATCLPSFAELRSIISELQSARSRLAALEGALGAARMMAGNAAYNLAQVNVDRDEVIRAFTDIETSTRAALSPNDALNTRGE